MTDEPRKASDVLLELLSEVKTLNGLVRAQDLNIKILSNKLNEVMNKVNSGPVAQPSASAPAAPPKLPPQSLLQNVPLDPERQVPISAEVKLPATDKPDGFRRTSRPETFDPNQQKGPAPNQAQGKMPVQIPKAPPGRQNESIMDVVAQMPKPKKANDTPPSPFPPPATPSKPKQPIVQNAIPIMQRVVDSNGKSIYMADVEILDAETLQPVHKTRTSGMGKWVASLGVGSYRISIHKSASNQRAEVKAEQDVYVDGTQSPLELKTLCVR